MTTYHYGATQFGSSDTYRTRIHWLSIDPAGSVIVVTIIHNFLTGGAGVGKSMLTRAIIQATYRFCQADPSRDPDKKPILMIAPTGTAAYNINGLTEAVSAEE
jgi:hypothetical protein